jgi:ribosome-binding ATPase
MPVEATMEFGILGLELSGKTTLFSLLTGHDVAPGHGKAGAHVGVASVPDPRLDRLSELLKPRKHTPATVRFVDIPGITRGGAQALNLSELRTMDGLAVVVRAFPSDSVPHPEGNIDPARDLELLETELLLADLTVVDNRLERLEKDVSKRKSAEAEAERDALLRCKSSLDAGQPLRRLDLSGDELRRLKGFTLLSQKPLLVILNVGEGDAADLAGAVSRANLAPWQGQGGLATSVVCATLEQEISRLASADQAAFLAELGLPDRALDRLLRSAYGLLGLISFFTVGEDECRAWSIPAGTAAVKAAGVIHTDLERGFIRAEVVPWQELLDAGSLTVCRNRGHLRLEGKDYTVQDGDVITIRFNI